jgi:predicted hydrocarbon binding protein
MLFIFLEVFVEDRLMENKAFRVILLGIEEIVGENGLKSVLNYSGLTKYIDNLPPNDTEKGGPRISESTRLDVAIEEVFGKQGARAILFQVGRMIAKWGLDENPDVAQAAQSAFSTMSERDRAKTILTYAANEISIQLNTETWVEEDGDDFLIKDKACTYCYGRTSDAPVCHPANGFWAGLVDWAVGNKEWRAKETSCTAMGEPFCTCRVYKE